MGWSGVPSHDSTQAEPRTAGVLSRSEGEGVGVNPLSQSFAGLQDREPGGHDMSRLRIDLPQEALAEFCRRNLIRRLSVFGSALRDDFTPDSDVDLLVEFEPGATPGLAFFGM